MSLVSVPYRREDAVRYARTWAFARNPAYLNFDPYGGDCTNFISQCVYAGGGVMNYTKDTGWYYRSPEDRAAAWTGVEYLYTFLVNKRGGGPWGHPVAVTHVEPGDIVQLAFEEQRFGHSLLITQTGVIPDMSNILICAHTYDSYDRPLDSYEYLKIRYLKIVDIKK